MLTDGHLPLILGTPDPRTELARAVVAALDALRVDDVTAADCMPARMLPAELREMIATRRQAFNDLAEAIDAGTVDPAWLARHAAQDRALCAALGGDDDDGPAEVGVAVAGAQTVEDATELEREAWGRWMLVTGALIGARMASGRELTGGALHDLLATAADALDEDTASRAVLRAT